MNLEKPIAQGNTAKIYLHNERIIKVFEESLPNYEAEHEANKQRYAYSCGLPVPYVYTVTKVNGKQAIIMEHISGMTIGDLILGDMSKAERYMDLSVHVQLRIHSIKEPALELMVDKLHRQISSVRQLNDRQKNALLEKLYAMKFDTHLCHGDYHVFNLIINENNVTIIDWVDASAGDVRADAYRTYLLYAHTSLELADLYMKLYCNKSGIRQDEILQWAPIIAGARLSENVSSEKESKLIEIVNQFCPLKA